MFRCNFQRISPEACSKAQFLIISRSLFTTRPKLNVKTTKQHIETFTNKYRINPLRREVNKVISSCRCAWCGASSKKVREGFRDELSKKEYQISALCQKCQDEVFGGSDEK